jgi:uncharacterized spore protein YtfJ
MTEKDAAMAEAKEAAEKQGAGAKLLERIMEKMGGQAHVTSVFGEPIERDGLTVIPVARLRWFFGAGMGSGPTEASGDDAPAGTGEGSGGGGGGGAEPVGYVEIGPHGAIFRPIEDANQMPSAALVLAAGISAALLIRAITKLLRG